MKITKDAILIVFAIVILFFTALIDWNLYSWFILIGIILLIIGWYFKKK